MNKEQIKYLIEQAFSAKKRAYAPYSGFCVGAALQVESGKLYLGCNIENAGYSPTCCAERVAIFKAVYEGERGFKAIAIVSDSKRPTAPCGVCRQVLAEFCSPDMTIICADREGNYIAKTLNELMPMAFSGDDMK